MNTSEIFVKRRTSKWNAAAIALLFFAGAAAATAQAPGGANPAEQAVKAREAAASSAVRADGGADVLTPTLGSGWGRETHPDIAAFAAWATAVSKQGGARTLAASSVRDGVTLAKAHRAALTAIAQLDPKRALAAALPVSLRRTLPQSVVRELEAPFSAIGDYAVYCQLRAKGGPKVIPERREITIGGRLYAAQVYGRRAGLTSKRNIFLHGILLGNHAILDENALRVLPPGESAIETRKPTELGAAAAKNTGFLADGGGVLYRFGSAEQIQQAEKTLRALEALRTPETADISERIALEDPTSATPLSESEYTTGNKKILVIRVDFSDKAGDPTDNGTTYTAAVTQNVMDSEISPYYLKSSYSLTSLTNTVSTKVYRLPRTAVDYAQSGDNFGVHDDARAAAAADYDVDSYDRVCVFFSSLGGIPNSQITYGGLAQVGGPLLWVNGEFDFRVLAHELGHTYGLVHGNYWEVSDGNPASLGGTSVEYGDPFETMGGNFEFGTETDFCIWYKTLLDWVPSSTVQLVTESGTYRVSRSDGPSSAGVLALKIVRDGVRNYWLSVRRNFVENFPISHGLYVTWGYNTPYTQQNVLDLQTPGTNPLDAPLPTGSTFIDAGAQISISAVSEGGVVNAEYEDVRITFGNGVTPFINSAGSATGAAFRPFTYQITATNGPTAFNATDLPPGLSVNTANGVISGTPTVPGVYTVTISASNASGTGTALLILTFGAGNDDFINAQQLGGVASGSVTGSNVSATKEPNEPNHADNPGGASIWYDWTPAVSGFVAFDTLGSAFDTLLAVYTGNDVGTLAPVANNDDDVADLTSYVQFAVKAGTTYHIAVDGYAGDSGSVQLNWTESASGAPVITSSLVATGQVGLPFYYQIAGTFRPTVFRATGLPPGLSLDVSSGVISGIPTAMGTYPASIGVGNENGTGAATLVITIAIAPPVITSSPAESARAGGTFLYRITATNSPTSFGATGLPPGLTVDAATGVISGVPASGGTYQVVVSAANISGTGSATLTLTLAPPLPVITSALSASAQVGAPFAYQIAASNGATAFSVAGSAMPEGLSVNPATGLISGTPMVIGTFRLNVTATSAEGSGAAELTLNVEPGAIPVVKIIAKGAATASENGARGKFVFSRTGGDISNDLVVTYKIKGTAVNGRDYEQIRNTVVIPAGASSVKLKIKAVDNGEQDGARMVLLKLVASESYIMDLPKKAKVFILDND